MAEPACFSCIIINVILSSFAFTMKKRTQSRRKFIKKAGAAAIGAAISTTILGLGEKATRPTAEKNVKRQSVNETKVAPRVRQRISKPTSEARTATNDKTEPPPRRPGVPTRYRPEVTVIPLS